LDDKGLTKGVFLRRHLQEARDSQFKVFLISKHWTNNHLFNSRVTCDWIILYLQPLFRDFPYIINSEWLFYY